MLIRSNMLPRNQNAGDLEEMPLRTVHQRPPKKIAPSKSPAINASARNKTLFIVVLRFVVHGLVFLGNPVPRIQTADRQSDHQQRQCPWMFAWVMIIQPDA